MVIVESLVKQFQAPEGTLRAVDMVSFHVKEGAFYTLLGPSGCGKTTTLRCVAGLEFPDGGSILLGGLSRLRNIERRAEVPWLARIPLVGFLLKSEGYNDEKETLMILIRAQITDVREEMAKVERRY